MHINDTASSVPSLSQNTHNSTPIPTTPDCPKPALTLSIALRAISNRKRKRAIVIRKMAIVIVLAIVIIALYLYAPKIVAGLIFGSGLFAVNTMIDSKMGGQS